MPGDGAGGDPAAGVAAAAAGGGTGGGGGSESGAGARSGGPARRVIRRRAARGQVRTARSASASAAASSGRTALQHVRDLVDEQAAALRGGRARYVPSAKPTAVAEARTPARRGLLGRPAGARGRRGRGRRPGCARTPPPSRRGPGRRAGRARSCGECGAGAAGRARGRRAAAWAPRRAVGAAGYSAWVSCLRCRALGLIRRRAGTVSGTAVQGTAVQGTARGQDDLDGDVPAGSTRPAVPARPRVGRAGPRRDGLRRRAGCGAPGESQRPFQRRGQRVGQPAGLDRGGGGHPQRADPDPDRGLVPAHADSPQVRRGTGRFCLRSSSAELGLDHVPTHGGARLRRRGRRPRARRCGWSHR